MLPWHRHGATLAAAAALVVAFGDEGATSDPPSDGQPQDLSWWEGLCKHQRRFLGMASIPPSAISPGPASVQNGQNPAMGEQALGWCIGIQGI